MGNTIDANEATRLDTLTSYCSTILNGLAGHDLDRALVTEHKRYAMSDAAYRKFALERTHPDDLVASILRAGFNLASVGIESITVGAV